METQALNDLRDKIAGTGVELGAKIDVALGALGRQAQRAERRENRLWAGVHPVPIAVQPLTASVNVDLANLLGPNDGYYWDVRRLSVWGITAGSVAVYWNTTDGEKVANFSQDGQYTWSGQLLLGPRDRLIYVPSSALTGSVYIGGQAIEVQDEFLPEYLI